MMINEKSSLLDKPIIAINIGLNQFAESLEAQEIEVVNVNWLPPANGDEEIMDLLDTLL